MFNKTSCFTLKIFVIINIMVPELQTILNNPAIHKNIAYISYLTFIEFEFTIMLFKSLYILAVNRVKSMCIQQMFEMLVKNIFSNFWTMNK